VVPYYFLTRTETASAAWGGRPSPRRPALLRGSRQPENRPSIHSEKNFQLAHRSRAIILCKTPLPSLSKKPFLLLPALPFRAPWVRSVAKKRALCARSVKCGRRPSGRRAERALSSSVEDLSTGLEGFLFIQSSKIQDSRRVQIEESNGWRFYYEIFGDSCEVSGAKAPVTVKIRGDSVRSWGRCYEVSGAFQPTMRLWGKRPEWPQTPRIAALAGTACRPTMNFWGWCACGPRGPGARRIRRVAGRPARPCR
jgi:hypothetical protein